MKTVNKTEDSQEKDLQGQTLRVDLPSVFWDVDINKLDLQKHAKLIITQAINYGSVAVIQHVFQYYGRETIKIALEKPIKGTWFPKIYHSFCTLLDVLPQKQAINITVVQKKMTGKMDTFLQSL